MPHPKEGYAGRRIVPPALRELSKSAAKEKTQAKKPTAPVQTNTRATRASTKASTKASKANAFARLNKAKVAKAIKEKATPKTKPKQPAKNTTKATPKGKTPTKGKTLDKKTPNGEASKKLVDLDSLIHIVEYRVCGQLSSAAYTLEERIDNLKGTVHWLMVNPQEFTHPEKGTKEDVAAEIANTIGHPNTASNPLTLVELQSFVGEMSEASKKGVFDDLYIIGEGTWRHKKFPNEDVVY